MFNIVMSTRNHVYVIMLKRYMEIDLWWCGIQRVSDPQLDRLVIELITCIVISLF